MATKEVILNKIQILITNHFEKPEDANKCIEDLNGKEMWGHKLELEIFKP